MHTVFYGVKVHPTITLLVTAYALQLRQITHRSEEYLFDWMPLLKYSFKDPQSFSKTQLCSEVQSISGAHLFRCAELEQIAVIT